MKPSLLFWRAEAGDAALLTRIARAAKEHWGYPADWMEAWQDDLTITPEYIRDQPVEVAGLGDIVVGFLGLKQSADGWHLEHLWLRPEYIGRGLGRPLFAEAMRQARVAGATELRIKSDPNAEAFYLKMGAVRTGLEVYQLPGKIRREVPLLVYQL